MSHLFPSEDPAPQVLLISTRTRDKLHEEFRNKKRFFLKKNDFYIKFQRNDLFQSKRFFSLTLSKFPASSLRLSANQRYKLQIIELEDRKYEFSDFETLFSLLSESEAYSRSCGLIGLRKLFRENNKNDNFFEDYKNLSNFLRIILKMAKNQDDLYAQFESFWILSNLPLFKGDFMGFLVDQGVLLILLENIDHKNVEIREFSIWGLANILHKHQIYRKRLLKLGIVGKLVNFLKKSGEECKEIAFWTIFNIFITKPTLEWQLFIQIYDELLVIIKEETTSNENLISALSLLVHYTGNKKNK